MKWIKNKICIKNSVNTDLFMFNLTYFLYFLDNFSSPILLGIH